MAGVEGLIARIVSAVDDLGRDRITKVSCKL
jgi:hypothetical protein